MNLLENYAKEQEKLYLTFFENALTLQKAIDEANEKAHSHILEGNYYERIYSFSPYQENTIEGDGYYEKRFSGLAYFNNLYGHFEEANQLFIQRIKQRYEDVNGPIEVFSPIKKDIEDILTPHTAEEVLAWLKEESSGLTLLKHWQHQNKFYPFQQKGRKVSFNYGYSWDKEDEYEDRVYAPSWYHELFGLLHFFETGTTSFRKAYEDVMDTVQYMTAPTLKQAIELDFSSVFHSIRFYMNGRIDLTFKNEEDASKFMKWLGIPQTIK